MPSMVQRERWERMVPRAVSIASRTPAILWARRLGRATMDHLRDSAGPIFSDRQGRADRRGEVALTSRPTIHWAGPGLCKTQAFEPLQPAHGKLEHCLMPTLKRNDIVVIDNL